MVTGLTINPVAVTLAGGNGVWKQYAGGIMESCKPSDPLDHSVLAVG